MAGEFMDALRRLLEEVGSEPDAVRRVEIRIREQFGGGAVYIGKKGVSAQGKAQRLAEAVAAGVPIKTAFESAGVSRAQGFRILSRPWRRR